jgi:hypothetical protein
MIRIIKKSLDNSEIFETISENFEQIVNKICFENFILKEEELVEFEESPKDYLSKLSVILDYTDTFSIRS